MEKFSFGIYTKENIENEVNTYNKAKLDRKKMKKTLRVLKRDKFKFSLKKGREEYVKMADEAIEETKIILDFLDLEIKSFKLFKFICYARYRLKMKEKDLSYYTDTYMNCIQKMKEIGDKI